MLFMFNVTTAQTTNSCVVDSAFGVRTSDNEYQLDLLCQPVLINTLEIAPGDSVSVTVGLERYFGATGVSTTEFELRFAIQRAQLRMTLANPFRVIDIVDTDGSLQNFVLSASDAEYVLQIENTGSQPALFDLSVRPDASQEFTGGVALAEAPAVTFTTATPRPTNTRAPTDAPVQTYYAAGNANLRICPQTTNECRVAGTVSGGTALNVVGQVDGTLVSGSTLWLVLNHDGQRLYIHSSLATRQQPAVQPAQATRAPQVDPVSPTQPAPVSPPVAGCVDINTADHANLQRIIHIGPERAQQIINLRPFRSVDDLVRVSGIAAAR